jgi:hypothetical protein
MDEKKLAAIAGALAWLEGEEAVSPIAAAPAAASSAWALHGRQSIMTMRSLLQRRVLRRR